MFHIICIFKSLSFMTSIVMFYKQGDEFTDAFNNSDRYRRSNIALLVALRHRVSGRRVLVANTHLFWNPAFEVGVPKL